MGNSMKRRLQRTSSTLLAPGFLLALSLVVAGCTLANKRHGTAASDSLPVRPDGGPISIPANAPSISQGFKPAPEKMALNTDSHTHEALDIIAEPGTPVLAPAPGTVLYSLYEPFSGNRIILDHGTTPDNRTIRSGVYHLQGRLVEKGARVVRGQQIGTLGRTGLLAGYPHVHFEIRVENENRQLEYLNPHLFWAGGVGVVTCFDSRRRWPELPFQTTYPVFCPETN